MLRAAVALADKAGIEALSMRKLAEELGVVPMALYKHVASKEELLDSMVDIVIGEVGPPAGGASWKSAIRQRILSARRSLQRHPWAPGRSSRERPVAGGAGLYRLDDRDVPAGGFSADLTRHALHALGSRLYGFTQEIFDDSQGLDPQTREMLVRQMKGRYPHIAR